MGRDLGGSQGAITLAGIENTEMRYYDPKNNRLVYVNKKANQDYWDQHWGGLDASRIYKSFVSPFNFVVSTTRKFLQPNSLILEGGAGFALNSWYLHLVGYRTIALDFAQQTVAYLQKNRPEVVPVLGDVRNLGILSETIDGYWSLGVIEHFYEGYDDILKEMYRVIKQNGYLFLTFPYMSPLRKIKARRGSYEPWTEVGDRVSSFYQFALDENRIIKDFEANGFKLVHKFGFDGVKGFKDEIRTGRRWIQSIYSGRTLPARLATRLIDVLLRSWSSHMTLLVLKKQTVSFNS